jgi:hypothetical protein
VFFYRQADVASIAAEARLREVRIIPIRSSGTGHILVGEGRHGGQ